MNEFATTSSSTRCPICGETATPLFRITVRQSIDTHVVQCNGCTFTFLPQSDWLHASFGDELQREDVGALDRNLLVADFLRPLIRSLSNQDITCVDWGGGYGLLSRLMRDRGINFHNYDEHTKQLFYSPAIATSDEVFDLLTLIEVSLHFTDPVEDFRKLMSRSSLVFFTCVVPPDPIPSDWWYLMPRTGQHVAMYPIESLRRIAEILDVGLVTDGRFFHLFHSRPVSLRTRALFKSRLLAFSLAQLMEFSDKFARALGRRKSLLERDSLH